MTERGSGKARQGGRRAREVARGTRRMARRAKEPLQQVHDRAMAMLGDCVATAEPVVEHTGQTRCEVEGCGSQIGAKVELRREENASEKSMLKYADGARFRQHLLLRRSLCANGAGQENRVFAGVPVSNQSGLSSV